ncbi:MAG: hypothetical protein PHP50_12135 [Lachnospiraceae bacterium]|nr:hypothetical protein [Lachnospiraceae bacterium]
MGNEHKKDVKMALEKIFENGVRLFMDGMESSPDKIADHCVSEKMNYMPDYVVNGEGILTEIRYDKISFV